MGDKIEFPFNSQMYLKQALACVEREAYGEALAFIEKAYELDANPYVNHFYTLTLSTLERYEEALEVANDHKEFYLEHEHNALLYATLLIKNNLFIEAEYLIQQNNVQSFSLFKQEWEKLAQELELEREVVSFEIEMKNKKTKRKLIDIGQYSPMDQIEIIQEARALELSDLQVIAASMFSNPMVSGQIQRSFLELLIEKQDDTQYAFPWFNQHKMLCPKDLYLFRETPTVEKMEFVLESKLHKYPTLLEIVKIEMMNDLLLLYPFIEEVVTDLDFWAACYIEQLDYTKQISVETTAKTQEQDKMKDWLQQLNIISQRKFKKDLLE